MTPHNNSDPSGDLRLHPLPELLIEVVQANLTGSLRVAHESKKTIIYFRDGRVVCGASNVRDFRLAYRLLRSQRVEQTMLRNCDVLANDMEFGVWLLNNRLLNADELREAFVSQIEDIVTEALGWTEGTWTFSASARLRSDVAYQINLFALLLNHARSVAAESAAGRLAGEREIFARQINDVPDLRLEPDEACVLETFGFTPLSFEQLRTSLKMPDAGLAQLLYRLWLGGRIVRAGWSQALSPAAVSEIKRARFSRVKDAAPLTAVTTEQVGAPPAAEEESATVPAVPQMTVDEWLLQADGARTHYDLLGISAAAGPDEIKNAYFTMARMFHPDRYHRETGDRLSRIQAAFARLAQAYDALKTRESREAYDYKIKKDIGIREKRAAAGADGAPANVQSEQALDNFEQGLRCLNNNEYAEAAVFLGRAVHYNRDNALYRAYFGIALAADDKQLHKAESELQAAAKLEPRNAKVRLMLAQFFIDRKLKKRAEGELTRFLEIAPDNKEARRLLDGLRSQI